MNLSRQLDITKATLHFWIDQRWLPAELLPGKLELLSRIVDYGNDYGITVCIENLSERSESFSSAFEIIPDLRMTLDIGHAQLLRKKNTSFVSSKITFPELFISMYMTTVEAQALKMISICRWERELWIIWQL